MTNEIVQKVLIKSKFNTLEVQADFPEHGVYFHPLPRRFQAIYKEGDKVYGYFGKVRDSGKRDVKNRKIYMRPFIPH